MNKKNSEKNQGKTENDDKKNRSNSNSNQNSHPHTSNFDPRYDVIILSIVQLTLYSSKRSGQHPPPSHNKKSKQDDNQVEGQIARLKETYGFISVPGMRENVFFVKNSVDGNFDDFYEGKG